MSTKKSTTKNNSSKNASTKLSRDDGPTEYFPKRGSRKVGKPKVAIPMIAGNGAKQKAAKDATKVSPKTGKPATVKHRVSGLDAAAQVLAEARKGMTCQAIVDAMLKKGLWKTNGKTPAATLNAAMHREIKAKGRASRFWKSARGTFIVAKSAKH